MTGKPVVLAPAMNTRMWQNPATRANLEILAQRENMTIVPPGCGLLACGETGEGHLADQETVLLWLARALNGKEAPLLRRHVVVTAGGTQEPIDPVRVITNKSSGKMGIALADAAFMLGADVTLLAAEGLADSLEKPYSVEAFTTAESLLNKAKDAMTTADWLIMAAAVGDYKAAESLEHKIKRSESPELSIQLRANPDILATLSRNKRPDQRLIGFAAETRDLANQARQKLARKGCDAIIANDVSRSDIGFSSADNEVTLFTVDGLATTLPKQPKRTLAIEILKTLASSWTPGHGEPAQAMTETSLTRP
jgi:phosphopantothenoylcysteine decarboxylase/phosphopantothenate--cysteine ligase